MKSLIKPFKTIMLLLAAVQASPELLHACPGCAQAISESGGEGGIIAIYAILSGMPILIIGTIIAGIVFLKRESDNVNDTQTEKEFERTEGKNN